MKLRHLILPILLAGSGRLLSQIPLLNSNPSISNKVIYLDFDGQKVTGTSWNNGNTINALASTASSNNIRLIWQRVSEDYRPFNVNVTTDSTRFNNATPNSRIRVVITPTSAWYGSAGGVAYLGSFTWGGYPGTPCWVFENQLGYNSKSMAEAAAHEVGHTLSLMHQSTYNSSCVKTAEYNGGLGSGVTSWAPIMGVGYNRNVTIWHNGTNAVGCNNYQFDHSNSSPGITGNSFLSFLADDVGNTYNTAKVLNLNSLNLADSGIITTPTDVDAYRFTICNNRYVSINVKPWALDTNATSYSGANLDVKLKLFDMSNTLLAADSSNSKLNGLVGLTLAPGSYYFSVDGGASANYTDYGSLGKYYVAVKATNPPQLANTIVTPTSLCAGQTTTLNYTSNGTPNSWQWTITGPAQASFAVANPAFNFSPPGIYTITLLATGSNSGSCASTKTIDAGNISTLTLAGTNTVLCPQRSGSLSAGGATSYTWLPGNFTGPSLVVNPVANTTYTLIGANGNCINSVSSTLTVSPGFTVSLSTSHATICPGNSATLTAGGASSYTFNPGNMVGSTAVVSPTFNTNYTVNANFNGCIKNSYVLVKVSPLFGIVVNPSDTIVCAGQSFTFNASGASSYTLNPGGITANPMVLTQSVTTIYTVTGSNANACLADTTILVELDNCDIAGIGKQSSRALLNVFPNPATNGFVIENSGESLEIEITDVNGALILKKSSWGVKQMEVSTENWNKGLYFLRFESNGKTLGAQKLIVK